MAQGQALNRDLGTYTYDEVGRVAAGTDAAGLTLEFAYDDLNHVVRVSYPDGTSKDLTYSSCCPHLITVDQYLFVVMYMTDVQPVLVNVVASGPPLHVMDTKESVFTTLYAMGMTTVSSELKYIARKEMK